ncbi:GL17664 [Drosophila persimilis]|uniref:GL17664 n=1 Tax=Drosophila persimilis TaxID=7234 RepID=B4GI68_DROPE|nr:general odorant-binding protein 57c [Drosophila persimilis]EDW36188.1 GL17664 [Drosophila persimilis]
MLHVSIAISLLVVALTESLPTTLDESDLMNECLYFSHITLEELQAQMNVSSSEEDLENLDRKYKCFAHCLVARANLLDSRGRVDVAKIDELEPLTDEHRQALENCKRAHDDDPDNCEYAFSMFLCLSDYLEASDEVDEEQEKDNDLNE